MAQIARFTTPAFTYKPSMVRVSDVAKIFFVLWQDDDILVQKDITQATVSENGFTWILSQNETQILVSRKKAFGKIDYLTTSGLRYTTRTKVFEITESAINEVI